MISMGRYNGEVGHYDGFVEDCDEWGEGSSKLKDENYNNWRAGLSTDATWIDGLTIVESTWLNLICLGPLVWNSFSGFNLFD